MYTYSDPLSLMLRCSTVVHSQENEYCIGKFPSLGWVLWLCPSLHQGKIASLKLLFIEVSMQVRSVVFRRVAEMEMKY